MTKTIRSLIEKAHEQGKLRYAPETLNFDVKEMNLDLSRTGMSGVEFGYQPEDDIIPWAFQSIDGVDLEPTDFLDELAKAVDEDPAEYRNADEGDEGDEGDELESWAVMVTFKLPKDHFDNYEAIDWAEAVGDQTDWEVKDVKAVQVKQR